MWWKTVIRTMPAMWAVLGAAPPTGAQQVTAAPVVTEYYGFHSDPWINLHHFLYQWARDELGVASGRQEVVVGEREGRLPSGAELTAWRAAVDFYGEHFARRGHFDFELLELKTALTELGGDLAAAPPDLVEGHAEVLGAAMAVYRAQWWPDHDRANQRWIQLVIDRVRRYEARWVATVERAFGGSWLDGRLRVDVSAYANWAGGYTSNGPPHTVVWSRDLLNQDAMYGLEMVFHEPGHMSSLGSPMRGTINRIFRAANVEPPPNLQHAILFVTSGDLVRRIAAEEGRPEHVPYIVSEGLSGFAGWRDAYELVSVHWPPVVAGEADPEVVLRAMAAEWGR